MPLAAAPKPIADPDLGSRFKQALRGVASTVHIITASDGIRRHGMTATAVMSVTMDPPALVICLNKSTLLHDILSCARSFCVNVLDETQESLSTAFSGGVPPAERFNRGSWSFDDGGIAYLEDAQSSIFCEKVAAMPYGTHSLFIGEVRSVRFGGRQAPLLYHNASYCSSLPRLRTD